MTSYAIRGGAEGARRLNLLGEVMAPTTDALLGLAGVAAGMRCIDVGCGVGQVSRALAARVGPSGRVVGVDFDPVKLEEARRECDRAGMGNVEFQQADVTTWTEPAAYDVVYGRFIVSHLPDRAGVVRRFAAALREPGLLILEDIDFTGAFCHPPNPAFARYCELYTRLIARRGGDANAGATLYRLCLDAGLRNLSLRVVQPTHCDCTPEKELSLSTLINIGDAAVAEGLITRSELDETTAELAAYIRDGSTTVACPRIFQVWGRTSPLAAT
jgi:ubiquinone/menaquinone biosynthesis C-methylase UbiE